MADSVSITIDKDLRPAYYDDFHCLAAGCRLSCCKGWRIPFHKKDYLSLKRQKGTENLNNRLEQGERCIRDKEDIHYGEFDMSSGDCPLLREDCLCALQAEKCHSALPEVCRVFPRAGAYLPGYLERSLSPACEGVLELLWNLPGGCCGGQGGVVSHDGLRYPRPHTQRGPADRAAGRVVPERQCHPGTHGDSIKRLKRSKQAELRRRMDFHPCAVSA